METPEGMSRALWQRHRRAGLARAGVPGAVRRHGARFRGPDRAHGGDGPGGDARAVLLHRAPGRPRPSRGRRRGAEEGLASPHRGRRGPGDPRRGWTRAPFRRPTASSWRRRRRRAGASRSPARSSSCPTPTPPTRWSWPPGPVRERRGEGVTLFLVPRDSPGLSVALLPTMDQTRKLCEVTLAEVSLEPGAVLGRSAAAGHRSNACSSAPRSPCARRCAGAPRKCST